MTDQYHEKDSLQILIDNLARRKKPAQQGQQPIPFAGNVQSEKKPDLSANQVPAPLPLFDPKSLKKPR